MKSFKQNDAGKQGGVSAVCFSKDESLVICGVKPDRSLSGFAKIYRIDNGKCVLTINCGFLGIVNSLCVSIDGRRLITAHSMSIQIWDIESGSLESKWDCLSESSLESRRTYEKNAQPPKMVTPILYVLFLSLPIICTW